MENENLEKELMDFCLAYSTKANPENFIEYLTVLTEAYMDQCGLSLTYRTLIEGAGQYWLELLQKSDHPLAEFVGKKRTFTGVMPYLSEEFAARKEHYWHYDITVLDSDVIIEATPALIDEYRHDETFMIAYCAGIIPFIRETKEFEVIRNEIMGSLGR